MEKAMPEIATRSQSENASSTDRFGLVQADVRAMVRERGWGERHHPKNLAMCIASEAGELVGELRWATGEESDAMCRDPKYRQAIVDEAADIAVSLLMFSDRIGMDLCDAIHAKLAGIRAKYPAEGT